MYGVYMYKSMIMSINKISERTRGNEKRRRHYNHGTRPSSSSVHHVYLGRKSASTWAEFPGASPGKRSGTELRNRWCKAWTEFLFFCFADLCWFYLHAQRDHHCQLCFIKSTSMARLSGLQREVLSLYRKCLREIRKKPVVSLEIQKKRIPGNTSINQSIANALPLYLK